MVHGPRSTQQLLTRGNWPTVARWGQTLGQFSAQYQKVPYPLAARRLAGLLKSFEETRGIGQALCTASVENIPGIIALLEQQTEARSIIDEEMAPRLEETLYLQELGMQSLLNTRSLAEDPTAKTLAASLFHFFEPQSDEPSSVFALPHATFLAAVDKGRDAVSFFNEGVDLERQGNIAEALTTYGKIFTADPEVTQPSAHALACLNIGRHYILNSYYASAAYVLRHALTIEPYRVDARYNYAIALIALNQPYMALAQLQRVAEQLHEIEESVGIHPFPEELPLAQLHSFDIADDVRKDAGMLTEALARDFMSSRTIALANRATRVLTTLNVDIPLWQDLHEQTTRAIRRKAPAQHQKLSDPHLRRLSRKIIRMLRHAPWEFDLEVDVQGWVAIDDLLASLHLLPRMTAVDAKTLHKIVEEYAGGRLEARAGRLRALYGHSLPGQLWKVPQTPPDYLFHGAPRETVESIVANGLLSGQRQYVHLSTTETQALRVAQRKAREVVIFRMHTPPLIDSGVLFFRGNDRVWLTNYLPGEILEIYKTS
jgi:putative RNA 2'-phosphotransferase